MSYNFTRLWLVEWLDWLIDRFIYHWRIDCFVIWLSCLLIWFFLAITDSCFPSTSRSSFRRIGEPNNLGSKHHLLQPASLLWPSDDKAAASGAPSSSSCSGAKSAPAKFLRQSSTAVETAEKECTTDHRLTAESSPGSVQGSSLAGRVVAECCRCSTAKDHAVRCADHTDGGAAAGSSSRFVELIADW